MDSFRCLIVMLNCLFQIKVYSCFFLKKNPKQTRGLDINGFVVHSDHSMCVQQVQVPHTEFLMKDIRNRYTSVIIKDLLNKNVFTSLFYLTDFIAINCEQMQFKFCIRNDIAKIITCAYIIDTSLNYN